LATFVKYYAFVDDLVKGNHNLSTAVFKVALTNTAPSLTDATWAVGTAPAPAAALGYTAGGNTITTTSAVTTTGTFKLILANTVFTAAGGAIGPFRYAILYNSSNAAKAIGYYDYGVSTTLNDTETFTATFDATNGVFTLA
jgi:hypothetical protein